MKRQKSEKFWFDPNETRMTFLWFRVLAVLADTPISIPHSFLTPFRAFRLGWSPTQSLLAWFFLEPQSQVFAMWQAAQTGPVQ
jgi:hypothetical protein